MKTRKWLWALLVLVAMSAIAWYQSAPRVPAGQPPLVTLDAASMEQFRADFNENSDRARIIVLVAPT